MLEVDPFSWETMVLRQCAWCGKDLGKRGASDEREDRPVSHGVCLDCLRLVLAEGAPSLRDFLGRFPKPVFFVGAGGRVVAGNAQALATVGKSHAEIEGQLGGDAFSCAYADLPGGCGKTVHCKTCTIRLTVAETMMTGQAHHRVPAYQDLHFEAGVCEVEFLISTESAEGGVLLRIDAVTVGEARAT